MSQTKQGSVVEAVTNILVGFGVNFGANWILLPLFGFASLTLRNNLIIGAIYTIISLIRSYVLRRIFNKIKAFETT